VKLAFAGGGTGGHLFPGLAVADLAVRAGLADDVVFLGALRGIEARLVPEAGYELLAYDVEGVSGRGAAARLRALAKLASAVMAARSQLRRRRIEALVGLGGYASAAGVIAARLSGTPVVLLEQNRVAGMANRRLARFARFVCISFEDTARCFPAAACRVTGNPLRAGLEVVTPYPARAGLLVFGGSTGALNLNRAFTRAAASLSAEMPLPPIIHQTGSACVDEVRDSYARSSIDVRIETFISDMAQAYGSARLAVCRAGATTIAELAATATPSILVPYGGAGDHQRANALAMVEAGAALMVEDDSACAGNLAAALAGLLRDQEKLNSMSAAAAALNTPGAAARVLDVIREATRID
jgi:UDP-N-acetylglucosamine--N-acetylmuramyl-(pentapeptide) pyrophosphoryl-undecaprenol N-acetylglucosamine transferase